MEKFKLQSFLLPLKFPSDWRRYEIPMEEFIAIIVVFFLGFSFGRVRQRISENQGEAIVRKELVKYCRGSTAHILNNITLKCNDGTTQIDHILISQKGILVVETKHYSGWLFCSEKQKYWTQVIYRMKNKFQNPLKQNYKHICAVQDLLDFLPNENINGVVVFTGDATFKTKRPEDVIQLEELREYIDKYSTPEISENRVQFCVGRLECARFEVTKITDIEHQDYLERKFGSANN